MANKFEKKLVVNISGTVTELDGEKGIIVDEAFYTLADIIDSINVDDEIKIGINSTVE